MYHLIKECNQARWAIKILAQDLCGLEREQKHLVLKQRTAELSLWELERLEILELEKNSINDVIRNSMAHSISEQY
ncbi:MAG: hypothetical protein KDD56_06430 [Bdellovibrionales bacterium]|nr:hypothetical protein [Bdellovibrionales bacterium]